MGYILDSFKMAIIDFSFELEAFFNLIRQEREYDEFELALRPLTDQTKLSKIRQARPFSDSVNFCSHVKKDNDLLLK